MNSLFVIAPYKHLGMWVFDDPKTGLVQEPFVGGADLIIDRMTARIPDAEKGFRAVFSAEPFPGYGFQLVWRRPELSGNVYFCEETGQEGWLCPAMFRYFEAPPERLYVKVEPLS